MFLELRKSENWVSPDSIYSIFLFFPLLGVRCCLQLFHRLICYSSPPSSVFFFQSPSSPVFFTSLLTQSSHLSLGLPHLLLPCSSNSAALCDSRSSAILSMYPAHCNLRLTSLSVKLFCKLQIFLFLAMYWGGGGGQVKTAAFILLNLRTQTYTRW